MPAAAFRYPVLAVTFRAIPSTYGCTRSRANGPNGLYRSTNAPLGDPSLGGHGHPPPGTCSHISSPTIASAVTSTQSIRSSMLVTAAPGQVLLSGQFSHHVSCPPPVTGSQVLSTSQNFPWSTDPPPIAQSSRVAAATHEFPVPVRQ